MRYTKNITGLARLRKNEEYKPKPISTYIPTTKEESKDTRIRKEINSIIDNMIQQNKSNMEIQIFLANEYPDYTEYIIKMIKHHFNKLNQKKLTKDSNDKAGEER